MSTISFDTGSVQARRGADAPAQAWAQVAARLLLAPLFLYSGMGKMLALAATAARLPGGEGVLGFTLALAAGCTELGGGMLLLFGIQVCLAALGLIAFTAAATLMFHQFWVVPSAQAALQTIQFLKNLGIAGALGLLAAFGGGPYSLPALWAKGRSGKVAPASRTP